MAPQSSTTTTCTSGCLVTKRVHTVCAHITEDRTSCPRTMWERHDSSGSNSSSSSPTSSSSSPRSPVARLFQRSLPPRNDSGSTSTSTGAATPTTTTGCGDPAVKIEYTIGWCPWCTSFYAPLAVDNGAMVEAYWAYKTEAGLLAPLRHPREVTSSQILSQTAAAGSRSSGGGGRRRARRPDGRWAETESLDAALASVGVRDPSGCLVELLVRATALRCGRDDDDDGEAALLLLPSMVRRGGGGGGSRRVWDPRDAFGAVSSPVRRPPWLQQPVTPAPLHEVWGCGDAGIPEPTGPPPTTRLLLSEPVVGTLTVCERHSRMIAGDGMCEDCSAEECRPATGSGSQWPI